MRALVAGGGGFLGKHLVAALAERGIEAVAAGHGTDLPLDFRLEEQVSEVFRETCPDLVFHLAASTRATDPHHENVTHPMMNVLDAAGKTPVVVVSHALVHGRAPVGDDAPLRPLGLYAAARASAETLARRVAGKRRQDVRLARPVLLLGPGLGRSNEVGDWLADHAQGHTEIRTGNLNRFRDGIDVRDAATALCLIGEQGRAGEAYTLVSGEVRSLRSIFSDLVPGALPVAGAAPCEPEPEVLAGSPAKIEGLGWKRRFAWAETVADTRSAAAAVGGTR